MLSLSNILTPLAGELGIGGLGGFLSGYATKKVAKVIAVVIGVFFLSLQYLAYKDVIAINYNALEIFINELIGPASGAQTWLTDIMIYAPFGAAFIGGFYIGLQKG